MRVSQDAAFHTLRLLQHAQNNNMSGHVKLAMYMPLISNSFFKNVLHVSRRLESDEVQDLTVWPNELDSGPMEFGGDDDGGIFGFNFMELMDDAYLDNLNQCGVDVPTVLAAAAMAGESFFGDDEVEENEVEENEGDSESPDMMGMLFSAFGDNKDQEVCTTVDMMVVLSAAEDYLTCTGFGFLQEQFDTLDFDAIFAEVMDACGPLLDDDDELVVFPEVDERMDSFNTCMQSIFNDSSPLGRSIVNLYENIGKICDCTKTLGDNMPSCILEDEDEGGISVSLDVLKTSSCVIGVGCDALHDLCITEVEFLDACLPPYPYDDNIDCNNVMYACVDKGSSLAMIPPQVSLELPDICKDIGNKDVNKRFNQFQTQCEGKKDMYLETEEDQQSGEDFDTEEITEGQDYEEYSEIEERQQELEYLKQKKEQSEDKEIEQTMEGTSNTNEHDIVEEAMVQVDEQQQIEDQHMIETIKHNKSKEVKKESLNKTESDIPVTKEKHSGSLAVAGMAIAAVVVIAAFVKIRRKMNAHQDRKDFSQLRFEGDEEEFNSGFVIS